jgi:hypothetical protein
VSDANAGSSELASVGVLGHEGLAARPLGGDNSRNRGSSPSRKRRVKYLSKGNKIMFLGRILIAMGTNPTNPERSLKLDTPADRNPA